MAKQKGSLAAAALLAFSIAGYASLCYTPKEKPVVQEVQCEVKVDQHDDYSMMPESDTLDEKVR